MAWDQSKHKVVATKEVPVGDEIYILEAYSYNGGKTKVAIRQQITKKKETMIIPLRGGITVKAARLLGKEMRNFAKSLSEE